LAVLERLVVGAVGYEIGAPTILFLDDGEGIFQAGAVSKTAAFTLPVIVN
jgi:hypothetical protein